MDIRFDDMGVLVTGASTGIGAAIATAFATSGARVALHYGKSKGSAEAVAEAIRRKGGEAPFLVQADVVDGNAIEGMVKSVLQQLGTIDVLVNSAGGMLDRSEVEFMPEATYAQLMDLNMGSIFRVCRCVIPHMKSRNKGAIINLSSIAARTGGGGGAVLYAAAKAAVSTFTRGLAKELAPYRIRVNGIAPGIVLTPFHDKSTPPGMLKSLVAGIPLGRAAAPEEVAGAAVFLASDQLSSFITGEIIEVNGGALMA